MNVLIISDSQTTADSLRQFLIRHQHACPPEHVVPASRARRALKSLAAPPQLILFVLPDQPAPAFKQLQLLREQTDTYIAVVGPASNPDLILESIYAGADDFLDTRNDLHQQLKRCLQSIAKLPERISSRGQNFDESQVDVKFLNVFRNSLMRSSQ